MAFHEIDSFSIKFREILQFSYLFLHFLALRATRRILFDIFAETKFGWTSNCTVYRPINSMLTLQLSLNPPLLIFLIVDKLHQCK